MGLCPMPQQGTLFPAPFLRFAAVLIRLFSIYREAINENGKSRNLRFLAGFGTESQRFSPKNEKNRKNPACSFVLYAQDKRVGEIK